MHPKQILQEAAQETGWNTDSMLTVCLDFIEQMNRGEPDFQRYVTSRVDEESEAFDEYLKDESEESD